MGETSTKWKADAVINSGGELGRLVGVHNQVREAVGEDVANTVITGSARLMAMYGNQSDSHGDKAAVGQGQLQIRAEGAELLRVYREAISKSFPKDNETKRQFGIGLPLHAKTAKSVYVGLVRFITGAEAAPDKAAAVHLSPEDLAKMKELRDKIADGKSFLGEAAVNAKSATIARRQLQSEIEAAMMKIVTAASIIYRKQPELVALFKSALPKRRGTRKGANQVSGGSASTEIEPK